MDRRALFVVLAGFWTGLVVLFMVRSITEEFATGFASFGRRIPEALLGALLCWTMCVIIERVDPRSLAARLLWVVCLSLPMGTIFTVAVTWAFNDGVSVFGGHCGGLPCVSDEAFNLVVEYSVNFTVVFLAWGAIYLGMRYSAQALAAERREGAARDEARIAELRALRYQVNPHFLFNALNSLGTLVDRGDTAAARGMIGEMGGFLRYGLSIDPTADVELEDEVDMQRRYFEIERIRFVQRLTVVIEVDPSLVHARIPSLLLQPLVENAVKHGVATTSSPVVVSIKANPLPNGRMTIVVEDDAPRSDAGKPIRFGVGLHNVSERLRARFGADGALTVGARPGGGFRAEIAIPVVRS